MTLLLATPAAAVQEVSTPVPPGAETVVPEGTVLPIVLSVYLNSRSTQVGDVFYADTLYPIWIQQRLVVPRGSTVRGTVTEVTRPGRIRGKGRMAVRFDDLLLPNGVSRNLTAIFRGIHGPGEETMDRDSETVQMGGSEGADAGVIVGSGSQGAIIGAVAGRSGTAAGIGAGAGAAVGIATVLFTRGRELVLTPGTQFDLELKQPLRFTHGEIDFTPAQIDSARRITAPQPREPNRAQPPGFPGARFPW
jgi:type IV secretion system protein VirB10